MGYAERSSCKEGLKPSGMLGALILKWKDNETFKVGTGFTEQQRKDIWKLDNSSYLCATENCNKQDGLCLTNGFKSVG